MANAMAMMYINDNDDVGVADAFGIDQSSVKQWFAV